MAETENADTNGDLDSKLTSSILSLEEIDINLYRGSSLWRPHQGRAVFGGQVIGQALVAASKTKLPDYHIHSLHCYFVRPGRDDTPILYHVDRIRDGASFLSRNVKAVQKGQTIFTMIVSFHNTDAESLTMFHQYTMPTSPPPDDLLTVDELMRLFLSQSELSERNRDRINKVLASDVPIEIKPIDPESYLTRRYGRGNVESGGKNAKGLLWIRAKGTVGSHERDTRNIHRCVAAYISDWTLLSTSLIPHPRFRPQMMASLDHSMWFHSDFRVDEWMLYESESPRLVHGRGLVLGRLWKQDGTLAVSVAQEGIMRGTESQPKL